MPGELVRLAVDGTEVVVAAGTTVAVAVMRGHRGVIRRSVSGEPRGALCGMGICFECRVTIDGVPGQRACRVACRDGMDVRTDGE